MKTTNLETSKKLKELGFEAETHLYWKNEKRIMSLVYHTSFDFPPPLNLVPAYDLETILEALPKSIEELGKLYFFDMTKLDFVYSNMIDGDIEGCYYHNKKENESLANTAGRLLIKLLEDNIIKLRE
jgi:hypothetical protein